MEEKPDQEKEQSEINKIDLSALQGFSFGTQWTPAEKASPNRREGREREHQGSRERQGGAHPQRDRRPARRPIGGAPRSPGGDQDPQGERREGGPRDPRQQGFRDRRDRGPAQQEHRPYISELFDVVFYPEDEVFHKIVQRVRDSKHTFELFEIARAVLAKVERCVIVVRRKPDATGTQPPVHVAAVDNLPFETEDAAIDHVVRTQMGNFFNVEEVELEAPKGSFALISRCGFTGELLGPPNYHRYQNILQQHHASRLPHMSFERFRDKLESVREPEVIAAWQEKMKKGTRYTWKNPPEGTEAQVFEAVEDARNHLLSNARDQVVRQFEHARFHGKLLETLPDGEIRRAIEGQLERQRRFPLDSANALRGRLRREGFTIFKKGSKGVSYVCAVKRRFRTPGQTFSDSINALIQFIETNSMISIRELPAKMLGIEMPQPAAAGEAPAEAKTHSPEEEIALRKLLTDLRWLVTEGYVTEFSDGRLFAPPPTRPQSKPDESGDETEEHTDDSEAQDSEGEPVEESETAPEAAPAAEVAEQVESAESPEPAAESSPEPAAEPAPEPAAEKAPEPAAETTPEPEQAEPKPGS